VVLLILWGFIVITIAFFRFISRTAAWCLVPYLLWVSFAGVLNYYIMILNY
jgi:tryptophan-rich sensory protein